MTVTATTATTTVSWCCARTGASIRCTSRIITTITSNHLFLYLFIIFIYLPSSFSTLAHTNPESCVYARHDLSARFRRNSLSDTTEKQKNKQKQHLSVISRALVLSFARSHGQRRYVVPRCDQSRASHPSGWYRSIFPLIPSLRSDTFKVYRSYQATRSSHDLALRTGNFNRPIT